MIKWARSRRLDRDHTLEYSQQLDKYASVREQTCHADSKAQLRSFRVAQSPDDTADSAPTDPKPPAPDTGCNLPIGEDRNHCQRTYDYVGIEKGLFKTRHSSRCIADSMEFNGKASSKAVKSANSANSSCVRIAGKVTYLTAIRFLISGWQPENVGGANSSSLALFLSAWRRCTWVGETPE